MNSKTVVPELETQTSHDFHSGSRICTCVVGVTYDGRQSVIVRISIGENILLRREPTNPYDPNAISVECQNGWQIGYLNRHLAAILAPFFDEYRQPVSACIHCLTGSLRTGYSLGVVITFTVP
jgi:single-stranded-DNA-specific exonuclease